MNNAELIQNISQALARAGDNEDTITRIAPAIAEAVQTLPIRDFSITYVSEGGFVSPEYTFGPVKHSIENAKSLAIATDGIDGSLLSRGKVTNLAKAVWFGVIQIPAIWYNDRDLRRRLAAPQSHLATVQELIFLGGFWDMSIDYETVICGYKMPGRQKDVDWRFHCSLGELRRWINLEAKRRDGDIKALLAGGRGVCDPFADVAPKFTSSAPDEINVAAIAVFGSDSAKVGEAAKVWLAKQENENVDCVMIWNEFHSTFQTVSLPSRAEKLADLNALVDPPIQTSERIPMVIRHPLPLPTPPEA